MYLRYRYKILDFKCITDTDTTKKYLDTRYIETVIMYHKYYICGTFLRSSIVIYHVLFTRVYKFI